MSKLSLTLHTFSITSSVAGLFLMKIGLKRISTQKGVTVEALLDSRAIGLVISLEFARK